MFECVPRTLALVPPPLELIAIDEFNITLQPIIVREKATLMAAGGRLAYENC